MRCIVSRRLFSACVLFCAVVSAATVVKAAVIVEAQGVLPATFSTPLAGGSFSAPYTVQSANTNVIVVGMYIDQLLAGAAAGTDTPITNLQFNGVAPGGSQNQLRDTLAYWSWVPGTTGPFNITGDVGALGGTADPIPHHGYVWELSGVDLSQGVDVGAPSTVGSPTSVSLATITTTSNNRLITDFYGANRQSGTSMAPTVGSPITTFNSVQYNVNSGGTVAGGTGPAPTAGLYTLGWTPTGGTTSTSTAELAYAFAEIPEPSSLMLLVGGVLMIAGRRRTIG